ncbi:MAG: NAD(P)H-binding protein, partial [Chitinophagaceae bacterium]
YGFNEIFSRICGCIRQVYAKIMSVRIATIIGATGLIGNHLLQILQKDDHFTTIRVLVRRPFAGTNFKTEVKLIDFNDPESFKLGIDGSHTVFCAVGTTQKKVNGDNKAYRKVDYDIAVHAARYGKETGCNQFLLVSSVGADAKSNFFYLRMKGEIEQEVGSLKLHSVSLFRPSLLLGARSEKRAGEGITGWAMKKISFLLPERYKAIAAPEVALCMVQASKKEMPGVSVYEYSEMKELLPG